MQSEGGREEYQPAGARGGRSGGGRGDGEKDRKNQGTGGLLPPPPPLGGLGDDPPAETSMSVRDRGATVEIVKGEGETDEHVKILSSAVLSPLLSSPLPREGGRENVK